MVRDWAQRRHLQVEQASPADIGGDELAGRLDGGQEEGQVSSRDRMPLLLRQDVLLCGVELGVSIQSSSPMSVLPV